ncbi:hypothetical protein ACO34A_13060 [Rhizobium sp. ACO-34A]|nr:hypothetical protein [Rhizobium sp. ACO-34A]ATN34729.1 hypothetical protein ACO34A_13060 [Rhizobium sp. ACO-34A]
MTNPYPLPRFIRQTNVLVGSGVAVYGPFAEFRIWDVADIVVLAKAAGDEEFLPVAVTVEKVSADEAFDFFTVDFGAAVPDTTQFVIYSRRLHERSAGVMDGTRIDPTALEKELSKQATVLQELRRDVNRSVAVDFYAERAEDAQDAAEAAAATAVGAAALFPTVGIDDAGLAVVVKPDLSGFALEQRLPGASCTSISQIQITPVAPGLVVFLNLSGREGLFRWVGGVDFSGLVAIDTAQGVYVPSSLVPASAGCWVRILDGKIWAQWFGLSSGNTGAENRAALLAACNFSKRIWGALEIPAGDFTFDAQVSVDLAGTNYALHIRGQGRGKTVMRWPSTNGLWVSRSNGDWWMGGDDGKPSNVFSVHGIEFVCTGGTAGVAAGVAVTFYGNDVVGRQPPRFLVADCTFRSDSTAYCWATGVQTLSASSGVVRGCDWWGAAAHTDIGKFIWFRAIASGQDASPYHVIDCYAFYFQIAVQGESYVEGIHVTNCDFVAGAYGVFYECAASDESQLVMTNSHVNATVHAVALTRVQHSQIGNNLLWSSGPSVVNLIDASSSTITGNSLACIDAATGVGTAINVANVTYGAATTVLRASSIDGNSIEGAAIGISLGVNTRNYRIGNSNSFAQCTADVQDNSNINLVGETVYKDATAAGTPASTSATTLKSVALPAAYLKVGKRIRILVSGTTGANTNAKTVSLQLNGGQIAGFSTTVSGDVWYMEADIYIRGASSELSVARGMYGANSQMTTLLALGLAIASGLTVSLVGTNGTATAGDIVCQAMHVEILDK